MDGLSDIEADAELMRRAAAHDAAACRILVDAHLPRITAFAYYMLGQREAAEDVAQDAFLRLWRQAPDWKPRAKVSTWLHTVARNLALDQLRARRPVDPIDDMELRDERPTPFVEHARSELASTVQAALDALPERQRSALVLVHYQGLSNPETAEILEVSVEAVESLLSRARRSLRQTLKSVRADYFEGAE